MGLTNIARYTGCSGYLDDVSATTVIKVINSLITSVFWLFNTARVQINSLFTPIIKDLSKSSVSDLDLHWIRIFGPLDPDLDPEEEKQQGYILYELHQNHFVPLPFWSKNNFSQIYSDCLFTFSDLDLHI